MLNRKLFVLVLSVAVLAGMMLPASASRVMDFTNGGFEADTANWDTNPAAGSSIVSTGAYSGTKCFKFVTPPGASQQILNTYTGLAYTKGVKLRTTAWVKTVLGTGGTPKISLRRHEYDTPGSVTVWDAEDAAITVDTPTWTKMIGNIYTVTGGSDTPGGNLNGGFLWIRCAVDTTGVTGDSQVFFDAVQLIAEPDDFVNDLTNGGFESGLAAWDTNPAPGCAVDTTEFNEGVQGLKMVVPAAGSQQVLNTYTGPLYTVGKPVRASAWVKTAYGTGGTPSAQLRRHEYDTPGSVTVWDGEIARLAGEQATWTKMSGDFVVTGGSAVQDGDLRGGYLWLRLVVDTTGVTGDSNVFWDDVQLVGLPADDPTNGFKNAGFEMGLANWTVWGPVTGLTGTSQTVAANLHGGIRSLQFDVPDTSYVKVQYNYKGAMYVRANVLNVSGWVKTVGGAPSIYILAYQTDDAGANKGYGIVGTLGDPSTSWVKVSAQVQPAVDPLSVTSTATLQINYFVDCATGGATTAYWDDMRMDVAPAGTLANGGFEAGIAASDAGNGMPFQYPASGGVWSTVTDSPKAGVKCAKHVVPANNSSQYLIYRCDSPMYTIGRHVEAAIWVKAQFGPGGTVNTTGLFRHEYQSGGGTVSVWNGLIASQQGSIDVWTQIKGDFIVTGGAPDLQTPCTAGQSMWLMIRDDVTGTTGDSTFFYDEMTLGDWIAPAAASNWELY